MSIDSGIHGRGWHIDLCTMAQLIKIQIKMRFGDVIYEIRVEKIY